MSGKSVSKTARSRKIEISKEKTANVSACSPYFADKNDSLALPSFIKKRKSKDQSMNNDTVSESKKSCSVNSFEPIECISNDDSLYATPPLPPPKEDAGKLKRLLALEKVEQRTEAWYALRKSMITASDWAAVLGKGKSSSKNDVVLKKCGQGVPFRGNIFTEWGVKYEPVATRLYELRNKLTIHEFGVLRHPKYSFLGASPDGISPFGVMLEIKCPYTRKITGVVPPYYWVQIQGQLEVCDLQYCDFLECQIEEYMGGIDEYEDDTEVNPPARVYDVDSSLQKKFKHKDVFLRTKDGFEKGATVTYVDQDGNKHYFYSELGVSRKEFDRWYKKHKKDVDPRWTETKVSFWRFLKISCVRVERDKCWFEEALPKLIEVWKEIEHYRKIGCDSIIKKQKDDHHSSMIDEPDDKDIGAAIHHNNDFGCLADSFLSGDLGFSNEKISVVPIESTDSNSNETVLPPPKNIDMILDAMQNVSMSTRREDKKTILQQPEPQNKGSKFDISHQQSIFELELCSWTLPRYIPFNPVMINERAIEETKVKLVGLCKIVVRCKSALVRLNRLPHSLLLESTYPLQNIVQSIDVWIHGLPDLLERFLKETQIELSEEIQEEVKNAIAVSNKWIKTAYPKWCEMWGQENDTNTVSQEERSLSTNLEEKEETEGNSIVDHSDPLTKNAQEPIVEKRPLTPIEEAMKKPISELAPSRYAEIMNNEITSDARIRDSSLIGSNEVRVSDSQKDEELNILESLRGTFIQLDQFKYRK